MSEDKNPTSAGEEILAVDDTPGSTHVEGEPVGLRFADSELGNKWWHK